VEAEARPFLSNMREASAFKYAMLDIREGFINGASVVLAVCGVGKVNAAAAAQILIDRCRPERIIVSGTAGGMAPNVQTGDTVVATESVYHDVLPDILEKNHPYLPDAVFKSDPGMVSMLQKILAQNPPAHPVHFGRVATGEAFIETEGRAGIIERLNPLCVDMETAAAAHVCYVNAVPFLAVRTVTDTAREPGVKNFFKNVNMAAERSYTIAAYLWRNI
jgi:adenosylhomocysteine nucleosidase